MVWAVLGHLLSIYWAENVQDAGHLGGVHSGGGRRGQAGEKVVEIEMACVHGTSGRAKPLEVKQPPLCIIAERLRSSKWSSPASTTLGVQGRPKIKFKVSFLHLCNRTNPVSAICYVKIENIPAGKWWERNRRYYSFHSEAYHFPKDTRR